MWKLIQTDKDSLPEWVGMKEIIVGTIVKASETL